MSHIEIGPLGEEIDNEKKTITIRRKWGSMPDVAVIIDYILSKFPDHSIGEIFDIVIPNRDLDAHVIEPSMISNNMITALKSNPPETNLDAVLSILRNPLILEHSYEKAMDRLKQTNPTKHTMIALGIERLAQMDPQPPSLYSGNDAPNGIC